MSWNAPTHQKTGNPLFGIPTSKANEHTSTKEKTSLIHGSLVMSSNATRMVISCGIAFLRRLVATLVMSSTVTTQSSSGQMASLLERRIVVALKIDIQDVNRILEKWSA